MVYQNKFVAVVKVNGKVLREINDVVTLPFGTEYSILLKNLDSVKMKVRVTIDGTDATSGWLVLSPNSNVNLERFITNGNLTSGNRFKFIERTEAIEDHRGIGDEDGLIRIEYARERQCPLYTFTPTYCNGSFPYQYEAAGLPIFKKYCTEPYSLGTLAPQTAMTTNRSALPNDAGITVPGSLSNQQFTTTWDFTIEQSEVLIIKLKGKVEEQPVQKPILVTTKLYCVTCGKAHKSSCGFCSGCGTALRIV